MISNPLRLDKKAHIFKANSMWAIIVYRHKHSKGEALLLYLSLSLDLFSDGYRMSPSRGIFNVYCCERDFMNAFKNENQGFIIRIPDTLKTF